ncbi:hypothetical protein CR513_39320, partial [Mucuna pruriens]
MIYKRKENAKTIPSGILFQKLAYAALGDRNTVFFSKRRKNSSQCFKHTAPDLPVGDSSKNRRMLLYMTKTRYSLVKGERIVRSVFITQLRALKQDKKHLSLSWILQPKHKGHSFELSPFSSRTQEILLLSQVITLQKFYYADDGIYSSVFI